jgi:hypothetical protein
MVRLGKGGWVTWAKKYVVQLSLLVAGQITETATSHTIWRLDDHEEKLDGQ